MEKLLLGLSVMFLFSCQPTRRLVDIGCPENKSEEFGKSSIENNGIAIIPVSTGSMDDRIGPLLDHAINIEFISKYGSSAVRTTHEVNYKTNELFYRPLDINPSLSTEARMLAKALDVNYLLFTEMLSKAEFKQQYPNVAPKKLSITQMQMKVQVWDSNQGQIVWDGLAGAGKVNHNMDIYTSCAASIYNVVGSAISADACNNFRILEKDLKKARRKEVNAIIWGTLGSGIILGLGTVALINAAY